MKRGGLLGESEAHDSSKERAIRFHCKKVLIVSDFVALKPIATAQPKMARREIFSPALDMKQTFALKSYGAEIVKEIDSRMRIVIEIVPYRGCKFCNRPLTRSGAIIRRPTDLEPRCDHSGVEHRPKAKFFVTPAIGIHRAKLPKTQIPFQARISYVCLATKSEAASQCCAALPTCVGVIDQELVFAIRGLALVANFKAELITEVKVSRKRDRRARTAARTEAGLAGWN